MKCPEILPELLHISLPSREKATSEAVGRPISVELIASAAPGGAYRVEPIARYGGPNVAALAARNG